MQAAYVILAILSSLTWTPYHPKRECLVFRDAASLATAWKADHGADANLPKVDFKKSMVVAMFDGSKPTTGYAIAIKRVVAMQNGKAWNLMVVYEETEPAPGSINGQMVMYPSSVVRVPTHAYTAVLTFDSHSKQGTEVMSLK